jgi:hypothetical protein
MQAFGRREIAAIEHAMRRILPFLCVGIWMLPLGSVQAADDPDDIYWVNSISPDTISGVNGWVRTITLYDGKLIASGEFIMAGGLTALIDYLYISFTPPEACQWRRTAISESYSRRSKPVLSRLTSCPDGLTLFELQEGDAVTY